MDCRADKQNQNKVISTITFFQFDELIDLKPEPYNIMPYSTSEPNNEEQQFDYQRLKARAVHFDFRIFQSHCSGHAYAEELMTIVKEINLNYFFPVRTEHPEMFKRTMQNITLVEENNSTAFSKAFYYCKIWLCHETWKYDSVISGLS